MNVFVCAVCKVFILPEAHADAIPTCREDITDCVKGKARFPVLSRIPTVSQERGASYL